MATIECPMVIIPYKWIRDASRSMMKQFEEVMMEQMKEWNVTAFTEDDDPSRSIVIYSFTISPPDLKRSSGDLERCPKCKSSCIVNLWGNNHCCIDCDWDNLSVLPISETASSEELESHDLPIDYPYPNSISENII